MRSALGQIGRVTCTISTEPNLPISLPLKAFQQPRICYIQPDLYQFALSLSQHQLRVASSTAMHQAGVGNIATVQNCSPSSKSQSVLHRQLSFSICDGRERIVSYSVADGVHASDMRPPCSPGLHWVSTPETCSRATETCLLKPRHIWTAGIFSGAVPLEVGAVCFIC